MTVIYKNTDLNSGVGSNNFEGWETCAASGAGVVVYTSNEFSAYSVDDGDNFLPLDPAGICNEKGEEFIGDQVVIYIPQISMFFWVIQTVAGNYVVAIARPDEIKSRGKDAWRAGTILSSRFGTGGEQMDFPELSIGSRFLFMSFNRGGHAIGLRMSLSEIKAPRHVKAGKKRVATPFFHATDNFWLRPVQNCGITGYFVSQNNTPERGWEIRVFRWNESAPLPDHIDFPIPTIPAEDWTVTNPDGNRWIPGPPPGTRIDQRITGATRSAQYIWVAWTAARRVDDTSLLNYMGEIDYTIFPFPHIEIAVLNMDTGSVRMKYLWNSKYAFAFPALATDGNGNVGISFCWGGGKRWYPQHGVGMLSVGMLSDRSSEIKAPITKKRMTTSSLISTTSHPRTQGAGGDYISVRMSDPPSRLCASGFTQDSRTKHPHYVVFGSEFKTPIAKKGRRDS
jgi:hypothetical protein